MTDGKSGRAQIPAPLVTANQDAKRNEARAKILGVKRERTALTLFGVDIEILQPSVGDVITSAESSPQSMVIELLLNNAYIPGTNIKVFEPADMDGLLGRPFGTEFRKVSNLLNEMLGITTKELDEAKGNSEKTH